MENAVYRQQPVQRSLAGTDGCSMLGPIRVNVTWKHIVSICRKTMEEYVDRI